MISWLLLLLSLWIIYTSRKVACQSVVTQSPCPFVKIEIEFSRWIFRTTDCCLPCIIRQLLIECYFLAYPISSHSISPLVHRTCILVVDFHSESLLSTCMYVCVRACVCVFFLSGKRTKGENRSNSQDIKTCDRLWQTHKFLINLIVSHIWRVAYEFTSFRWEQCFSVRMYMYFMYVYTYLCTF